MATATFASSNPSLSHAFFTLDDTHPAPGRPREASFSSYLSVLDESFSLRLSGEFTDRQPTSVQVRLGSGRKKAAAAAAAKDDELDVFGAEKYFSGGMDGEEVVVTPEKALEASPHKEAELTGRKTRPGTPSVRSDSSGNSRSSLLKDSRGDSRSRSSQRSSHHSAPGSKKFLGIFPCTCSDDSSVEVGKNTRESDGGGFPAGRPLGPRQARPEVWCNEEIMWRSTDRAGGGSLGPKREDCFSFPPALNPVVVENSTVGVKVFQEDQKMARVSSKDAFGNPFLGKEEIASSLRRGLTIMSPIAAGTGGAANTRDDDVCSESSSDLFEIECLSTSTVPVGGAGGTSSSTTCYEPSEASIEWSVVTASAANLSVASDSEVSPPKGRKDDGNHHQQRSGGGLLLGCGSAKAVNVASNTYRVPERAELAEWRQRQKSMDAVMPEMRYLSESPRSVDFEHGRAAHVLAARGIPRPVPAHAPHLSH